MMLFNNFNYKLGLGNQGPSDTTAPTVAAFAATTPSGLTIAITAFTASEEGVSFLITESSTQPEPDAAGWAAEAQTTYVVETVGTKTLYPWVKDTAGNVSSVYGSPASVIVPLFLDQFTAAEAAPMASPHTSDTGTLTLVQTDGELATTGGELAITAQTTPANGDQGFYSTAITRTAGRTLFGDFNFSVILNKYFDFGWLKNQNLNTSAYANMGACLSVNSLNFLAVMDLKGYDTTIPIPKGLPFTAALAMRAAGGMVFVKGNRFTNWCLLYAGEGGVYDEYIGLSNYNETGTLDNLSAVDIAGNLATDKAIALVNVASPTNPQTATGSANGYVEVSWQPASSEVFELSFRYTDDNNRWLIRCDQANSKIYLYSVVGGVETEQGGAGGAAQTWNTANTYLIQVYFLGRYVTLRTANSTKRSITNASVNYAATGVKVSGGATVTNLTAWPATLASVDAAKLNTASGKTSDATIPSYLFSAAAEYAADPLTTPTYDESGEVVHPSVIDFVETWNGYRYWMAMTPLPANNAAYENPSILASADKATWVVPDGLTNPIVPFPTDGATANSDPNLYYESGTLYCTFRTYKDSGSPQYGRIWETHSTNGIAWSTPVMLLEGAVLDTLSPSLIKAGSTYYIYCADLTVASPYKMTRRSCSTITGAWSAAVDCTRPASASVINHTNVIYADGKFYAVIAKTITLAVSDDGLAFDEMPVSIFVGTNPAWSASQIYVATIGRTATGFDLFYTGVSAGNAWRVGYTPITWLP